MATLVLISEAIQEIPYTKEHVSLLLREQKIQGRKAGGIWFVDLDDLKAYYLKMEELGPKRHNPHR